MSASERPPSKLIGTVYRTYFLGEQQRNRMTIARTAESKTIGEFLAAAIVEHLPQIVAELQAVGIPGVSRHTRPARLPLDATMLSNLKEGAQATGVPASRLLSACLDRACRIKLE